MLRYRSFVSRIEWPEPAAAAKKGISATVCSIASASAALGDASAAAACRTPRAPCAHRSRVRSSSARSRARNAPSAVALSGESSIFIERRMRSYIEMCSTAKSSASTVVYTRWLPLRPKTW